MKNSMNKFWSLVETSVIVSGLIALVLIGSMCYLAVTQQEIPNTLSDATMVVVGFFFGKGSQLSIQRVQQRKIGG